MSRVEDDMQEIHIEPETSVPSAQAECGHLFGFSDSEQFFLCVTPVERAAC